MGRAERRAKERAERKREVRMTPEKIRELKESTAREACRKVEEMQKARSKETTEKALDMLLLFGMTVLHEQKDSWGKKRLEQYYDGCMALLTDFEQGKCTFRSLRDKLVEETGIQLSEV